MSINVIALVVIAALYSTIVFF